MLIRTYPLFVCSIIKTNIPKRWNSWGSPTLFAIRMILISEVKGRGRKRKRVVRDAEEEEVWRVIRIRWRRMKSQSLGRDPEIDALFLVDMSVSK